jgi:phosphate transport system substrate-binding protein
MMREQAEAEAVIAKRHLQASQVLPLPRQEIFEHLRDAGAAKDMPDDFRVSITNAPGKDAYTISTFTWLLIPNKMADAAKANAIKGFRKLTNGRGYTAAMSYAPLPKPVVAKEEKQIASIQ